MTAVETHAARFDHDAFREAILDFLGQHRMAKCELASRAGINNTSVQLYLQGKASCGLASVASLALICDLDLGDYVRPARALTGRLAS